MLCSRPYRVPCRRPSAGSLSVNHSINRPEDTCALDLVSSHVDKCIPSTRARARASGLGGALAALWHYRPPNTAAAFHYFSSCTLGLELQSLPLPLLRLADEWKFQLSYFRVFAIFLFLGLSFPRSGIRTELPRFAFVPYATLSRMGKLPSRRHTASQLQETTLPLYHWG